MSCISLQFLETYFTPWMENQTPSLFAVKSPAITRWHLGKSNLLLKHIGSRLNKNRQAPGAPDPITATLPTCCAQNPKLYKPKWLPWVNTCWEFSHFISKLGKGASRSLWPKYKASGCQQLNWLQGLPLVPQEIHCGNLVISEKEMNFRETLRAIHLCHHILSLDRPQASYEHSALPEWWFHSWSTLS